MKERQKEACKGGGGATMCHNILLSSKVVMEWGNIPFKIKNQLTSAQKSSKKLIQMYFKRK